MPGSRLHANDERERRYLRGGKGLAILAGSILNPAVRMFGTTSLFIAGVVPGLMLLLFFMVFILARAVFWPTSIQDAARAAPEHAGDIPGSLGRTLADLLPFGLLIFCVIGSLYAGWATPTESGVIVSLAIALIWARPKPRQLTKAVVSSAQITGAVLFIVYAAYLFSYAINMSGLPEHLTDWLIKLDLGPLSFMIAVFVLYALLGCIMDSLAMIVITAPLLFPIVLEYGYDPVWFGVALVILIELGQITPPLGLNLFVMQGIANAQLSNVIKGTLPFYAIMILALVVILIWSATVLWIPSHL